MAFCLHVCKKTKKMKNVEKRWFLQGFGPPWPSHFFLPPPSLGLLGISLPLKPPLHDPFVSFKVPFCLQLNVYNNSPQHAPSPEPQHVLTKSGLLVREVLLFLCFNNTSQTGRPILVKKCCGCSEDQYFVPKCKMQTCAPSCLL